MQRGCPTTLLHGSDIVAGLQKMCCEAVHEGMRAPRLDDLGRANRRFHGILQHAFVDVMQPRSRGFFLIQASRFIRLVSKVRDLRAARFSRLEGPNSTQSISSGIICLRG
jgi:hypothetical protein